MRLLKTYSIFKLSIKSMHNLLLFAVFIFLSQTARTQTPDFYLSPSSQCFSSGNNTTQAVVSVTIAGAASYTWSVTGPGSCNGTYTNVAVNGSIANVSFPCCGIYTVACTPYSVSGVPLTGLTITHTAVIQCPTFTANFSTIQTATQGINFTNNSSFSSTLVPVAYRWSFGDNTVSNIPNPSHSYSSTGIYTVTLIDSMSVSPFCRSTITKTVSVCQVNFTVPTPVYQGSTVNLAGLASPTNASSYFYWYSTGSPTAVQGPNQSTASIVFANSGVQTVTFGFSTGAPSCSMAMSQSINVLNPCTAFSYTQGSNGFVNFLPPPTSTVAGTTYTWNFGSGNFSFTPNTSFTYSANGSYSVALIISNSVCGTVASSMNVVVNSYTNLCTLSAGFSTFQAGNGVVSFSNTSVGTGTGSLYNWAFGDNTSSVATQTINHQYPANGTYLATLTVNNNSTPPCISSVVNTIVVNSYTSPCNLAVAFTRTQSGNGLVNFINTSSGTTAGATYLWNFGAGQGTSNAVSPAHTYTANGVYTVSLTVNNHVTPNCIFSTAQTITVSSVSSCSLSAGFTFTQAFNGQVNLTNITSGTNAGTSYTFANGNGGFFIATGASSFPSTQYTANGVFVATLTAKNSSNCVSISTATISVSNYTACYGILSHTNLANGQVGFNFSSVNPAAITYTWSFGNGVTFTISGSAGASVNTTYSANGTYQATLMVGGLPSCNSVYIQTLTVSNAGSPCTLNANFSTQNTNGGLVYFYDNSTGATGSITTQIWSFGDGNTAIGSFTTHTYINPGPYTVTLSVTSGSCSSTFTDVVNPCMVTAGYSYSIAANGQVSYTNTSTGLAGNSLLTWYFSDGQTATGPNAIHTYTANGAYVDSLLVTTPSIQCYYVSATHTIVINNIVPCSVTAAFSYSVNPSNPATIVFNNLSTATGTNLNYAWNFGDGATSTQINPSHTYSVPGTYSVSLNAVLGACSQSVTQAVFVPAPCTVAAAYSHTMGSGGQVNFTSLSAGTVSNTTYLWNFGDGFISTVKNPSHGYSNGGTHYVSLKVVNPACVDSTISAINISGVTCNANSGFTLLPTSVPKYWNAIPDYPWNVTKALWTWGDGASDTLLYTAHIYSVSSNYNICLTVTVSCGATSTTCTSYQVNKSVGDNAMDVISINVIKPGVLLTAINPVVNSENQFHIFPNPNNGEFSLILDGLTSSMAGVEVFNLFGQLVYQENKELTNGTLNSKIALNNLSNGIFFVTVRSGNKSFTRKIVVDK